MGLHVADGKPRLGLTALKLSKFVSTVRCECLCLCVYPCVSVSVRDCVSIPQTKNVFTSVKTFYCIKNSLCFVCDCVSIPLCFYC
jgi:hypothetical protein